MPACTAPKSNVAAMVAQAGPKSASRPSRTQPPARKHQYQGGRHIEVVEGHLHIRDRAQGETIGIFAPGKWHSAHVDAVPGRNGAVAGGGIRTRLGQSI